MKGPEKNRRVCKKGHVYYKSTDCPTCPVCEQERKPEEGFLSLVAAPAMRALEGAGIKTLTQLSRRTEKELSALHGMGPSAISKLRRVLASKGLKFRKQD
jgi:predicted RecB family nuclease